MRPFPGEESRPLSLARSRRALSRRLLLGLLGGACAGGASGAFARARPSGAGSEAAGMPQIQPNTALSRSSSRYARFALPGRFGMPRASVEIQPSPGLRVICYLPPGRPQARPVVFSHGELAEPGVYDALLGHWASHGFAVLAPIHDDSVIEKGLKARRADVLRGVSWDLEGLLNDAEDWRRRAAACRQVLDLLPALERTSSIRFPVDRPLLAGHSFGAYTAQLLLGAKARAVGGAAVESVEDPRFYGALLLSPQGRGAMGLDESSWREMARPSLVVTGNGDRSAGGQAEEAKLDPFSLSPPGNKHAAWFSSIYPTLYSGSQVVPDTAAHTSFLDLLAVTTAFLVAYGDYDREVFEEMTGDYYGKMTQGRVTMYYR